MASRAARNGTKKLPAKLPAKRPQPHGGALFVGGVPGHDGSKAGRPRKAFKKFCRELAGSEEYQQAIKAAATSDKHENFIGAAKLVAAFATSKPAKKVVHHHVSSARDRLAERLARLAERN